MEEISSEDVKIIVDAVNTVVDDNNKFGVLDATIDAAWHPDHLKPDSEEAYDKAVVVNTGILQKYKSSQSRSLGLLQSVALDLGESAYHNGDQVLSDRFVSWLNRLNAESFPPGEEEEDEDDDY